MSVLAKGVVKIKIFGNYKLHIILTDDIKEAVKEYRLKIQHHFTDIDDKFDGVHIPVQDSSLESYLFLVSTKPGVIAHEVFHAVTRILDLIGVSLVEESEETYAYLLGYIVDEVHTILDKYNKI